MNFVPDREHSVRVFHFRRSVKEEIADEYDGKVKVCKVNVDEEEDLAMRFGIASIPTLMVFKNGVCTDTQVGFAPKDQLLGMLL